MKLTYQTATATLIQFITLSFLGMANGLNSVTTTCRHTGKDCISNLIVSIIFFMLTAFWFGIIWSVGYMAEQRRSKLLARLLIAMEFLVAVVAFFNARHHTDILSLLTSLVDLALAVWIISLAIRLMRSGGRRITRPRQRVRKA